MFTTPSSMPKNAHHAKGSETGVAQPTTHLGPGLLQQLSHPPNNKVIQFTYNCGVPPTQITTYLPPTQITHQRPPNVQSPKQQGVCPQYHLTMGLLKASTMSAWACHHLGNWNVTYPPTQSRSPWAGMFKLPTTTVGFKGSLSPGLGWAWEYPLTKAGYRDVAHSNVTTTIQQNLEKKAHTCLPRGERETTSSSLGQQCSSISSGIFLYLFQE